MLMSLEDSYLLITPYRVHDQTVLIGTSQEPVVIRAEGQAEDGEGHMGIPIGIIDTGW